MEKRKYQRVKVDVNGIFVLSEKNITFREFTGSIEDISEGGIKIVIENMAPSVPTDSVEIGDTLHFTGTDEYKYLGKDKVSLVEGDAVVVRKEYEGNKIILGCAFQSLTNELAEYVKDKKASSFLISLVPNNK